MRQGIKTKDELDEVYKELKAKHSDNYDIPKLRLWARMVSSNLHESLDEPPDIPAFRGDAMNKKSKKGDSFSQALSGAVTAFADVLVNKNEKPAAEVRSIPSAVGADLRMKHFEQLRYAKQLNDELESDISEDGYSSSDVDSDANECDVPKIQIAQPPEVLEPSVPIQKCPVS